MNAPAPTHAAEYAAEYAANDTLHTLTQYRNALHTAQQVGTIPPVPPALSAAALVDAYGAAMNKYGARYMTFTAWMQQQQEPTPPRRFAVVGSND